MSDQAQGPGWWLASDGKWYPPDQAPAVPPAATWATPPQGPPPSSGMPTGAKVALIGGLAMVGLFVVIGLAALVLGSEPESSFESTETAIDGTDDGGTAGGGAVGLPDGFALLEGDGVSIAAPEDWQQIAPEDFAMSAEEYATAFPDAPEGMFEQGSTYFERGAVLVAFELTTDFSSNVNILDAPGEAPLSEVETQVESQLASFGAENVSVERVDLAVGEALRVEYTLDVALPDGSTIPAYGVQYYVPLGGHTYIITISTRDEIDELATTMIATFRVG